MRASQSGVRAAGEAAWRRLEQTPGGRFLEEFVEMRVIDRALALASKLFIAILPMSILITALFSGEAFGDELVDRFGLTGSGAQAARTLFAAPAQVQAGIGLIGVLILVSSILSFVRALERVYLDCWRLPPLPRGAVVKRLAWLVGFVLAVSLLSLRNAGETSSSAALSWLGVLVGGTLFFLWTPYLLLGGRVAARRLVPTAVSTGVALMVLAVGSDIAMPEIAARNTDRYGLIGFAFSLVSWLFSAAVLLIAAAILGALIERPATQGGSPGAGDPRITPIE